MATATMNALKEHKISYFNWIDKGADMSPIENVFNEIKRRIARITEDIIDQDSMYGEILKIANNSEMNELIKYQYSTLPRRWKDLYEAKGGPTKY
jgi:Zn-dependent M32 family carboxypeptidase